MEEKQVKIGFTYESPYGDKHESTSIVNYYEEFGDSELSAIGMQLNSFLALCGYIRSGTYMFMDSLTSDELEAVEGFMTEYRSQKEELQKIEDAKRPQPTEEELKVDESQISFSDIEVVDDDAPEVEP